MSSWFRPKYYGYGATPNTWQGWLLTLGFVAVITAITVLMGPGSALATGTGQIVGFVVAGLALVLFIWIVHRKTEGAWRWRWGSREQDK